MIPTSTDFVPLWSPLEPLFFAASVPFGPYDRTPEGSSGGVRGLSSAKRETLAVGIATTIAVTEISCAANDDGAWKALYHKHFIVGIVMCYTTGTMLFFRVGHALIFNWDRGGVQEIDLQLRDVRAFLDNAAWVTMDSYVGLGRGSFHVTNIFEFHHGRWLQHHSPMMLN
ncbi:hypothetical protein ZIOFF_074190 [Zingiber officinale]|uniref:Uncharacterized protein n=1 Tax=Zingiber officinale TaxID=94328 RepID=A0A8J5BY28_ZINOF|nr:hypothetical protein ZIOFF_074190 [Zingiber officinale]